MLRAVRFSLCVALLFLDAVPTTHAQDATGGQTPPVWQPTATRSVELFPAGDVFAVYVADPHRPTNQVTVGFYTRTSIPDSSSPRTTLSGGGRFGMVRIDSTAPGGRSWQISLDAGLDALFDSQYRNDGIGWDGNYGLTVTTATATSPLAFKVGLLHTSSHLGDEYQTRTQIQRTNYTREELALALSWRQHQRVRVYGELGIAYLMREERQERLRWQMGAEFERRPTVLGGRMAWYGATDLSLLQERGWRIDVSLQGGLVTRNKGRTIRLYLQWYDGRPTLGQFNWTSEAAFSIGLKLDL